MRKSSTSRCAVHRKRSEGAGRHGAVVSHGPWHDWSGLRGLAHYGMDWGRGAQRRQELLSAEGLLQDGGCFYERGRECGKPGDHDHLNSKIVKAVDQTKRHPILKFDIHDSEPGSVLTCQALSISRARGCPGDHHAYFFKKGLQRFGNKPAIFHDEDTQTSQTRRGSAEGLIHH